MPEGHVIHRIARDHAQEFTGQNLIVLSPQGRFAEGAEVLSGRKLQAVDAYGKHLFYRFGGGKRLHVHLGLYGKFRDHPAPPPEPVGQVRVRAIGERRAFDLNGPNACHLVTKDEQAAIVDRLGPDPLREDAEPDRAWDRIGRSRSAIGTLLMNQEVIAGVGNIYRSEVLHLMGVHPETPGRDLSGEQFDQMWERLAELMEIGLKHKRIITADPAQVGKPRSRMNRSERLLVYKYDRCTTCQAKIKSWQLAARTIYACPKCQKR